MIPAGPVARSVPTQRCLPRRVDGNTRVRRAPPGPSQEFVSSVVSHFSFSRTASPKTGGLGVVSAPNLGGLRGAKEAPPLDFFLTERSLAR